MTAFNQDFSMFAGQSRTVEFRVTDANGAPLSLVGASLQWLVKAGDTVVLTKTPTVVDATGGLARARVEVADNIAKGSYRHQLVLTQGADTETVAHGVLTVLS